MAKKDSTGELLRADSARVLSNTQKSRPFWGGRSPKWICRMIQSIESGCIPVTGGGYQVNRVNQPFLPIQVSHASSPTDLPARDLRIANSHPEGTPLEASFADYETSPRVVELATIQSVVQVHTRVAALYSDRFDQVEHQLTIAADYMYETKENLIFNHPDYGLLNNVAPKLQVSGAGPATPDVLDDLMSRVWKMPDFYVMHPEVLDSFHRECNARGLTPESVQIFGSAFTAWRGLPILPTNKLHLVAGGEEIKDGELIDRTPGVATSQVLLMRIGEQKQGVVSLFAAGSEGSDRFPFINVDFMSHSDQAVSSYLMTMYAAMAVCTPGALASAEVSV